MSENKTKLESKFSLKVFRINLLKIIP